MELHQLDYVLAVAKYKNFTKAADQICVSQSSLSLQINKLEEELGVRLFERTTRAVHLTPAGSEFILYAKRITDEIKQSRKSMQEYISQDKGHILIGAFPVLPHFGLTAPIASFQKEHPGVKLQILEAEDSDLLEMLNRSEIDVAYLAYHNEYKETAELTFYPLVYDELVLITDKNHRFAKKKMIDLKEAAQENFIFFVPTSIYNDASEVCREAGFEPRIAFLNPHGTRVETILGLVTEGLGITMFSSKVAALYKHLGISVIRFQPKKPRIVSLAIPKKNEKRPVIKNFLNYILKWVEK